MSGRLAWAISKGTVSEFMEDNVLRLAAALAYYAMFSIGPLLVDTVYAAENAADRTVTKRPLPMVASVLCAGFVGGWIAHRKLTKR